MSLYNDASLVMIPSAYKDGKLYSIKPTDGSGDFTFSRGSNLAATRVDENGLIEKGRENLLLQSNQFDTTWTTSNASVTSGQSGYDGSSDAWLLTATSTSNCRINQSISNSGVQTLSVYAKANTADFLAFNPIVVSTNPVAYFDLSNGTIGNTNSAVIDAKIVSVGSGWYRCSISFNDTNTQMRILVVDANGSTAVTSGNSIYIQDAQLEQGLVATDYIETTTTTAQAGILEDMPRLDYSGGASCPSLLLEPTRTNQVLNSEYRQGSDATDIRISSTSNASISPEGVQNATLYTENTDNNTHLHSLGYVGWVAGTTYTISVYAKSNGRNVQLSAGNPLIIQFTTAYDLTNGVVLFSSASSSSIEDAGNGWYRLTATATAATSSGTNINTFLYNDAISYLGDNTSGVYIYGYQKEEGSYATSYIPCYGAATSRSFDNGDVLDTNTFGTDGEDVTYFFEFVNNTLISRDSASTSIRVNNSASNLGSFRIYRSASTDYRLAVVFQDNNGSFSPSGTATSTDNAKVLIKREWATGLIEVFVNGVKEISATSLLFNEWSKIEIEGTGSTINIKQAAVFPSVLTDSECIALTTI